MKLTHTILLSALTMSMAYSSPARSQWFDGLKKAAESLGDAAKKVVNEAEKSVNGAATSSAGAPANTDNDYSGPPDKGVIRFRTRADLDPSLDTIATSRPWKLLRMYYGAEQLPMQEWVMLADLDGKGRSKTMGGLLYAPGMSFSAAYGLAGGMFGLRHFPPTKFGEGLAPNDWKAKLSAEIPARRVQDVTSFKYIWAPTSGGLTIAQVDSENLENVRTLMRDKTGLVEPVLVVGVDWKIQIDEPATKQLHSALAPILRIRPLEETMRFGRVIEGIVTAETAALGKAYVDEATPGGLFQLLAQKGSTAQRAEWRTIYNTRLLEALTSSGLASFDYVVLSNRSNYVVDELPRMAVQWNAYARKMREAFKRGDAGEVNNRLTAMRLYYGYAAHVEAYVDAMRSGANFGVMSLDLMSRDRLGSIVELGDSFVPDARFSVIDDKMVGINYGIVRRLFASEANGFADKFASCQRFDSNFSIADLKDNLLSIGTIEINQETVREKECWKPMRQTWDRLWGVALGESQFTDDVRVAGSFRQRQVAALASLVELSRQSLGLSGRLDSRRLK